MDGREDYMYEEEDEHTNGRAEEKAFGGMNGSAASTPARSPSVSTSSSRRHSQILPAHHQTPSEAAATAGASSPATPASSSASGSALPSVHALLMDLSSQLPPSLSHLLPPHSFFDRFQATRAKYADLKTNHSKLKAGFKDLILLKNTLEDQVESLKQYPPVPAVPVSNPELERLQADVLRLKKKCNKVQELARKEHEENNALRQAEAQRAGGWVGSLLMGGNSKPKPTPASLAEQTLLARFDVLQEELSTKIIENETLHQRIWSETREKDERERMLSERLIELKAALATMETSVHEANEAKQQAEEEKREAEEAMQEQLALASRELHQSSSQTHQSSQAHANTIRQYESLLAQAAELFARHAVLDDGSSLEREYSWANIDDDQPSVRSSLEPTASTDPAAIFPPIFSHALFNALASFLEDFFGNFQRVKSQLASVLRYWREMKQTELSAMVAALSMGAGATAARSPIADAASPNSRALPPDSFPQQTGAVRLQLTELNTLLLRTEERFEAFLGDIDRLKLDAQAIVRWKAPDDETEASRPKPLPLNALIDSFLAVLHTCARVLEWQIANLESKTAASGLSADGAGHRAYMVNVCVQYKHTHQLVREAIKIVTYLPARTGQPQSDSTTSANPFVRRHPAYQQALSLPAAWPIVFVMDALQTQGAPPSTNGDAATSAWPASPLPFMATLQAHLTNLTSQFAVLIGHEQKLDLASMASGSIAAQTKSPSVPNFVLSNLTTINKLLSNIPTSLVKYAQLIHARRRRSEQGNLKRMRERPRHQRDADRASFDVVDLTAFVPTAACSKSRPPSSPSSSTSPPPDANPGGIVSMVHLRGQAVGYLSRLHAQHARSTVAPTIPFVVAAEHAALLQSRQQEYEDMKRATSEMEVDLRAEQQTQRELRQQLAGLETILADERSSLAQAREALEIESQELSTIREALEASEQRASESEAANEAERTHSARQLAAARDEHEIVLEAHTAAVSLLEQRLSEAQSSESALRIQLAASESREQERIAEIESQRKEADAQTRLVYKQSTKLQSLSSELDSVRAHLVQAQRQLQLLHEQQVMSMEAAASPTSPVALKAREPQSDLVRVTFQYADETEELLVTLDAAPLDVVEAVPISLDDTKPQVPLGEQPAQGGVASWPLFTPPHSQRGSISCSPLPSPSQLLLAMQRGDSVATTDMAVQVDLAELEANTSDTPEPVDALFQPSQSRGTSGNSSHTSVLGSPSLDRLESGEDDAQTIEVADAPLSLPSLTVSSASPSHDLVSSAASSSVLRPLYRVKAREATDEIHPSDLEDDDDHDDAHAHGDGPLTASSPPSPAARGRASQAGRGVFPTSLASMEAACEALSPSPPLTTEESACALRQHALLSRLDEQSATLSSMQSALAQADAKASSYFLQLQQLARLLQSSLAQHDAAVAAAAASDARTARLREELTSTKSNYETMNIELTEKVCQLTEQLATQDATRQQEPRRFGGRLL